MLNNPARITAPGNGFTLPEELQYAAQYVANGGTDLKGLFRTLAQVEEMRQLDPSDEYDQAEIARQYLYATNFGTPEEIVLNEKSITGKYLKSYLN